MQADARRSMFLRYRNYKFIVIVLVLNKLRVPLIGKLYIDAMKVRANASTKRTKDISTFEKWLPGIREEMNELLKEARSIDEQEEAICKTDEEQELLKNLSNRQYLKVQFALIISVC